MSESVYESEDLYDPGDSIAVDEVLLDDEGVPEDLKIEFLKKPGRHLLGIGQTESGKTQKAYWFCKKLLPYEVIAWFDCGKSYDFGSQPEIAPLFGFNKPINIILPTNHELKENDPKQPNITIKNSPVPVTVKRSPDEENIWRFIEPESINIFIISYFFEDPEKYAKYMAKSFEHFIHLTQHNKLPRNILPMSIIIDEFHDIAPGVTMALSPSHLNSAKRIAWNINKIRSAGVRILGFTQKPTFIYPNCRTAMQFILCCRGAWFERDEPDLAAYNRHYKKLDTKQAICWFPKRRFKDHWNFKMYYAPDGLEITYNGAL